MPVYEIREKFTVLYRLVADSREDADAVWRAIRSHDAQGNLTEPAQAMLDLLDRDLQNLPDDVPAGLQKKLAAMPEYKPEVREVPAYELKAEREAADREFDDGFHSSLLP